LWNGKWSSKGRAFPTLDQHGKQLSDSLDDLIDCRMDSTRARCHGKAGEHLKFIRLDWNNVGDSLTLPLGMIQ